MGSTPFILGMRDAFLQALFAIAARDKNVIVISADNGAPTLDQFVQRLPNQFFTVGIAEQQMIGMAAGMAFEGKKVYTYAIAPFVTSRVHEQNKLDICSMRLPVVNLGVGAGYAYDIMGPSHHTVEDIAIMRALPHMKIHSPADSVCAEALAQITYEDPSPQYVRFDRAGIPTLYTDRSVDFREGLVVVREGRDLMIVATGIMVHQALKVAAELAEDGLAVGVLDVHRLKPVPTEHLFEALRGIPRIVSLEEHLLCGGLGGSLAEIFVDHGIRTPLLRIGQDDRFVFDYGGRSVIWRKYGLDVPGVVTRIRRWLAAVPRDPTAISADRRGLLPAE
jgi:transketolase